jgi:hypothetical protein
MESRHTTIPTAKAANITNGIAPNPPLPAPRKPLPLHLVSEKEPAYLSPQHAWPLCLALEPVGHQLQPTAHPLGEILVPHIYQLLPEPAWNPSPRASLCGPVPSWSMVPITSGSDSSRSDKPGTPSGVYPYGERRSGAPEGHLLTARSPKGKLAAGIRPKNGPKDAKHRYAA